MIKRNERTSFLEREVNILVADTDWSWSERIRRGLGQKGFKVDTSAHGIEACHQLENNDYDLVVLELEISRRSGIALLREMREKKAIPIIVVTSCGELEKKLLCLKNGAADYLLKPITFSELSARIALQLRRRENAEGAPLRLSVGDLVLDLSRTRVERAGRRLDLTRQEFALLLILMRHCGEIVSRKYLFEQVWGAPFESTGNLLNAAVRRLRQKMDEPFPNRLLHTAHGRGYVLEAEAEEAGVLEAVSSEFQAPCSLH